MGEIVALTGLGDVSIGYTVADAENPEALPTINIDEPTLLDDVWCSTRVRLPGARVSL